MRIPNTYTNNVFFEPWEGSKYKAGLDGLKIMVLGIDHYCFDRQKCKGETANEANYIQALQNLKNCSQTDFKAELKDLVALADKIKNTLAKVVENGEGKKGISKTRDYYNLLKDHEYTYIFSEPLSFENLENTINNLVNKIQGECPTIKPAWDVIKTDWSQFPKMPTYRALDRVICSAMLHGVSVQEQNSYICHLLKTVPLNTNGVCDMHTCLGPNKEKREDCQEGKHAVVCHYLEKSCAKLWVCKHTTSAVISFYSQNNRSFKTFEEILCEVFTSLKGKPNIWEHFLFANYYQRSMPYVDDGLNATLGCKKNENPLPALVEMIKVHEPNLVIVWSANNLFSDNDKTEIKKAFVYEEEKDGNTLVSLTNNQTKHKTWVCFVAHPSSLNRSKDEAKEAKVIAQIRKALEKAKGK